MPTITDLQEEIAGYESKVSDLMEAGQENQAHEAAGYLAALRNQLIDQAKAAEQRAAEIAASAAKMNAADELVTMGEKALGAKSAFNAIAPGWSASVAVNAATVLPTPVTTDTNLPAPAAKPIGFFGTIAKGVTNGDEKYFLQPTLTNGAATWEIGQTKPESAIEWKDHTSQLETVAHWTPVHKMMANRYSTLESQISGALMLGYSLVQDQKALFGNNTNGIIGATNFPGVNEWTYAEGDDNLVDNLADMAVLALLNSGYAPDHVALSPNAIRAIAKTKDKNGNYLFPNFKAGDVVPGTNLVSVEDVNMTVTTTTGSGDSAVTETKETALVYASGMVTYKTADPAQVTIGLVDKQFIQNAYTLLCEGTGLLRIDAPASLVYCADMKL